MDFRRAFLLVVAVLLGTTHFIVLTIAGGFFWIIVAVEVLAIAVQSFFLMRISLARSRDAFGQNDQAVFAIVPILNLWLASKRSKYETSANKVPTDPLLTGGLGVATGIVVYVVLAIIVIFTQIE